MVIKPTQQVAGGAGNAPRVEERENDKQRSKFQQKLEIAQSEEPSYQQADFREILGRAGWRQRTTPLSSAEERDIQRTFGNLVKADKPDRSSDEGRRDFALGSETLGSETLGSDDPELRGISRADLRTVDEMLRQMSRLKV